MRGTLLHQHESAVDDHGRTHGAEVYANYDGGYAARFHIRYYDGLKVTNTWSSAFVRIEAHTKEAAWIETRRRLDEFWRSLTGGDR